MAPQRWKQNLETTQMASDSGHHFQRPQFPLALELREGNHFPEVLVAVARTDIQHAFFSLRRCCAPSAAHCGSISCRPEAGDELRGRGGCLPQKCRQRPHLRL